MKQKRFNNLKVGDKIRLRDGLMGGFIYTITKILSEGEYKLSDGSIAYIAPNWSLVPSPRKPRKKKGNKI